MSMFNNDSYIPLTSDELATIKAKEDHLRQDYIEFVSRTLKAYREGFDTLDIPASPKPSCVALTEDMIAILEELEARDD